MNRYILITIISIFSFQAFSQTAITKQHNSFRHCDKVIRVQTDYIRPGAPGRNQLWDFSQIKIDGKESKQAYYYPTLNDTVNSLMLQSGTKCYYNLTNDTLFHTGFENRTTLVEYDKPEAYLKFPFKYGDTLKSVFKGKGVYCQSMFYKSEGVSISIVDAMGKLITPEGDTLKNVFRIHQLKTFDEMEGDSMKINLESYRWYARGFRYPIVESIKSKIYNERLEHESFSTSYYYTKQKRNELPEDPDNIALLKEAEQSADIVSGCNTYPNPVIDQLILKYQLSDKAKVLFRLCDRLGKVWTSVPVQNRSAGMQQQNISMSGFPKGEYCLYLIANDRTYLYKVLKQ